MSVQIPYLIHKENYTEMYIALAEEVFQCDRESGFIFTTPEYVLKGENKIKDVATQDCKSIAEALNIAKMQLNQALNDGHKEAILMGGIPFGHVNDLQLMLMDQSNIYQNVLYLHPDYKLPQLKGGDTRYVPSPEEFQQQVHAVIQDLKNTALNKVVLARSLELNFAENIDISQLFYNLAKYNQHGYNYAVATHASQNGWFVGASPEQLIAKQGRKIRSRPVAGTIPRIDDPQQDQLMAQQLLKSEKDHYEHALVIEMIGDILSPLCSSLTIPKIPTLISTKRLWHLASFIEGELKQDMHVLDLLEKLHPTPAICGQPTSLAREKISTVERFNRELFAGTMGWANAQGDGEWSVTVRCARVQAATARLFAGAGIVSSSNPNAERLETAAKFRTVLDGFGLSADQI
ncbi:isochorismate synthase [Acinetobacter shaoyimingii]|uniref:isochorismate synthase n=1 Tax=Acinetobacter shaoyimingii TaxID=2715164 RepID=A0A6G8RWN1_9GAMM|nr:isochorismate synthase [Acinetobacter shaoyimingii]QIO06133.1 isochorismate synthase [Acinetobacter shaoyimingii]